MATKGNHKGEMLRRAWNFAKAECDILKQLYLGNLTENSRRERPADLEAKVITQVAL